MSLQYANVCKPEVCELAVLKVGELNLAQVHALLWKPKTLLWEIAFMKVQFSDSKLMVSIPISTFSKKLNQGSKSKKVEIGFETFRFASKNYTFISTISHKRFQAR